MFSARTFGDPEFDLAKRKRSHELTLMQAPNAQSRWSWFPDALKFRSSVGPATGIALPFSHGILN